MKTTILLVAIIAILVILAFFAVCFVVFVMLKEKITKLLKYIFVSKKIEISGNVIAMKKKGQDAPSHVFYLNPLFIIVPRYLIKIKDIEGRILIILGIPNDLFVSIDFQKKICVKCKKYKWSRNYFFSAVIET